MDDTLLLRSPITDRLTKEQYGKAPFLYSNFSVSCTEDPAADGSSGSTSDPGSSSSSNSWLWPVRGAWPDQHAKRAAPAAALRSALLTGSGQSSFRL